MVITVNYDKCDGAECRKCVNICPMGVLTIEEDIVTVQNKEECSLCETCVDICPNMAIKIEND
jgi:Predicted ATPase, RNase L inhibitor (RLI) homolog